MKISVCMACYNGEQYIEEQLRSILSQLGEADEVIVSDDASTDRSLAVIDAIGDPRIRVVHSTYRHFKWNFQNAMQAATGDIIFLSDHDDVWLPGKVEACVKALEEVDLVCHNSMMTDSQLHVTNPNFFSLYHSGPGVLKNSLNNTYYGSCMAFRRRVMEAALPLPKTMEIGHDIWLGLVAEMIGKVRFIDTPYILYRRHNATSTHTDKLINRSHRPLWIKLWSRVVVFWNVMKFKISYGCKKH